MSTRETILGRIETFLAEQGMSERRFGLAAVGDHKVLARLRAGRSTLATIEKLEAFMAEAAEKDAAA